MGERARKLTRAEVEEMPLATVVWCENHFMNDDLGKDVYTVFPMMVTEPGPGGVLAWADKESSVVQEIGAGLENGKFILWDKRPEPEQITGGITVEQAEILAGEQNQGQEGRIIDIKEYQANNGIYVLDGLTEKTTESVIKARERRKHKLELEIEYLQSKGKAIDELRKEIEHLRHWGQINENDDKETKIEKMYLLTGNAEVVGNWTFEKISGYSTKDSARNEVKELLDIGYWKNVTELNELQARVYHMRKNTLFRQGCPNKHW